MMLKTSLFLTIIITLFGSLTLTSASKQNWSYEIVKSETNCMNKTASKNEDILDVKIRPVRIEPGVYALNGTLNISTDLDEHLYEIGIRFAHSSTGSSEYIPTPYQITKCSLHTFMNTHYKKYAMDDLSKCVTGLDVFESEWKGPFKGGQYVLNKCILKTDEMPSNLAYGYYKLTLHLSGPLVDCEVASTVKVSRKA